jgi:hypothetical protein
VVTGSKPKKCGNINNVGRGASRDFRNKLPHRSGVLCCNPRVRDHFEDPGVDGRIILRRLFRKWGVVVRTGLIWFRIGTVGQHL